MIEELVSRVFATRNAVHLAHWSSKSYAQHETLGHFYEDIIEALDSIVEAYQGAFGLLDAVENRVVNKSNIAEHLKQEARWIEQNAGEITGNIKAIQNLLDGLTDAYLTAYYKLTNLS